MSIPKVSPWDQVVSATKGIRRNQKASNLLMWLQSNNWNKERYDALENWERANLLTQSQGPLLKTGILREFPNAMKETLDDYGDTIATATTATTRTLSRLLIVVAFIAAAVVLVIYNKPLKAVLRIK